MWLQTSTLRSMILSKNKLIRNCLHFINHTLYWLTFSWLSSFINNPCFVISFFFYLCSQLWDCRRFLSHSDCSAWFLERPSECGKCTTTGNSQKTRSFPNRCGPLCPGLDRFQTYEFDLSVVPVPLHLHAFWPQPLRWHHSNSRRVQTSGRLCSPLLPLHLLLFFFF